MYPIYTTLIIGVIAALSITPIFRLLALKWKILDFPEERKIHKAAIPRLGGIAVFLSFLFALGKISFGSSALRSIILGAALIALIGIIDDLKGLGAKIKLGGQIVAALILVEQGIVLTFFPVNFLGKITAGVLTVIWIVGITNGMNFLDGMDGLAAGLAAIACLSFLIIALKTDQFFLALGASALLGSCLGFLPYNFHPAKIFLGDTGSTFLGFTLAGLAVMGGWAEKNPLVALGTPLIILGILVFDLIFITISRVLHQKIRNFWQWIDYVGKDHLHHRLFSLGFTHRETVLAVYLIGICLGIGGIILSEAGGLRTPILILTQSVLIFMIITILMNVGRRRLKNNLAEEGGDRK